MGGMSSKPRRALPRQGLLLLCLLVVPGCAGKKSNDVARSPVHDESASETPDPSPAPTAPEDPASAGQGLESGMPMDDVTASDTESEQFLAELAKLKPKERLQRVTPNVDKEVGDSVRAARVRLRLYRELGEPALNFDVAVRNGRAAIAIPSASEEALLGERSPEDLRKLVLEAAREVKGIDGAEIVSAEAMATYREEED